MTRVAEEVRVRWAWAPEPGQAGGMCTWGAGTSSPSLGCLALVMSRLSLHDARV